MKFKFNKALSIYVVMELNGNLSSCIILLNTLSNGLNILTIGSYSLENVIGLAVYMVVIDHLPVPVTFDDLIDGPNKLNYNLLASYFLLQILCISYTKPGSPLSICVF